MPKRTRKQRKEEEDEYCFSKEYEIATSDDQSEVKEPPVKRARKVKCTKTSKNRDSEKELKSKSLKKGRKKTKISDSDEEFDLEEDQKEVTDDEQVEPVWIQVRSGHYDFVIFSEGLLIRYLIHYFTKKSHYLLKKKRHLKRRNKNMKNHELFFYLNPITRRNLWSFNCLTIIYN